MPMMNETQRKLATQNIYLVHNVIHRYIEGIYPRTEFYNDLFQVGCEALCSAAIHANEINCSFSTYATACIKNAMFKFCKQENSIQVVESLSSQEDDESYNDKLACYDNYDDNVVSQTINDAKNTSKKQVKTGITILEYIAAGYKSDEICDNLKITRRTYKRSLEIGRKLLRTRLEAVLT